jgi:hypothetical protein
MRPNKLSTKAELMIFVGYNSKKNYVFICHTQWNQQYVSPTVIFDETFFPKCKDATRSPTSSLNKDAGTSPPQMEVPVNPPFTPGGATALPAPPLAPPRPAGPGPSPLRTP